VQDPEVPILIEQIYKIPNPTKLGGVAAKRNDLSAAFLTGFSKDVFAGRTFGGLGAGVLDADLNSLDLNEVSPNPAPAEYLRLNVNVARRSPVTAASAASAPSAVTSPASRTAAVCRTTSSTSPSGARGRARAPGGCDEERGRRPR
jgi:hypothetical protein